MKNCGPEFICHLIKKIVVEKTNKDQSYKTPRQLHTPKKVVLQASSRHELVH